MAHLLVGHRGAVLRVLGGEQHRQQVAAVAAVRAPVGDDAVNDPLEVGLRGREPPDRARRHAHPHARERQHQQVEPTEDVNQRLLDAPELVPQLGPEQGLAHDAHRQGAHLAEDVDDLAVPPAVGRLGPPARHDPGVAVEALVVEGRLDQPPLPAVVLALGGQQAVAEHDPRALQDPPLAHARGVGREDLLHEVGLGHQVHVQGAQAEPHERPVLVAQALEHADGIAPPLADEPQRAAPARARRPGGRPRPLLDRFRHDRRHHPPNGGGGSSPGLSAARRPPGRSRGARPGDVCRWPSVPAPSIGTAAGERQE